MRLWVTNLEEGLTPGEKLQVDTIREEIADCWCTGVQKGIERRAVNTFEAQNEMTCAQNPPPSNFRRLVLGCIRTD